MIKRLMIEKADRLFHLPPVIDEYLPRKRRKSMLGRDILDLARFQWPDGESDSINGDFRAATDKERIELAEETAAWYYRRYGVRVNPRRQIFVGGGIRQILNLLFLSFVDPGDVILIPDPGVWHYRAAAALTAASPVTYSLTEKDGFLPKVSSISENTLRLAKTMILNSPHNPTGAVFSEEQLSELLHAAGRDNTMLILDQAFETSSAHDPPLSLHRLPGGRKVGLELYSYAYTLGMTGPSLGFAVGQPPLIAGLRRVAQVFGVMLTKAHIACGRRACENHQQAIEPHKRNFSERRELVAALARKLKLTISGPQAGPFVWAKLPGRKQSQRFCRLLFLRCGILAVPGIAFGEEGEGFVRFSLTADKETIERAIDVSSRLFQTSRKESIGG
jgi:LL-diaminopimelate aminotransferase